MTRMVRPEAGFTLVELLASLLTGAAVLIAIGWSFSAIMRLLPIDPAEERARHLAAIAPTLERLLDEAAPTGFSGDAEGLTGIVRPPLAAGAAGPMRLRLTVAAEDGARSLVADFAPVAEPGAAAGPARRTVLASGYRAIRFEYLSDPRGERPLPRLITIVFDDGAAVRRISAAPRLDSDGSCRFDPISMSCRR